MPIAASPCVGTDVSFKIGLMMTTVSVLLPVRNAERFVEEAIASVLTQSLGDFKIIAVLDHSSDASGDILERLASDDARIRVLQCEGEGLVDALNTAAKAATGDLLARLDADDRMRPGRLEKQVDFLEHHPDVVAVGSAAVEIDARSRVTGMMKVPTADAALRARLMRANPFIHSSMMIRRGTFEAAGGYRDDFPLVEDFDLWLRLAARGRLANIASPLTDYRRNDTGLSASRAAEQRLNLQRCILAWKRDAGLLDEAKHTALSARLAALFARAQDLDGQPERMTGDDLALFTELLEHLPSVEARTLARLVSAAASAGKVSAAQSALFAFRARVTSRAAFARRCADAVKALQVR